MTVQYLSTTELQRSASAATVAFSHTAPAGQKGILVGFVRGLTSGAMSAVSYGGTNLVQYARATDTANEPGAAEWWYAPHTTTGAQNVSYNQGSPGSQVHVVVVSVGGDATPYVQASQTQSENTASLSVSLTTGYVSGLAFGALYWGGASPGDVTLGANQTLVHDWDMGAYGSKVTRSTDPTSSGTYYHTGGGDDVAFAVVFLTDGVITPGVGAVGVSSLSLEVKPPLNTHAPTLRTERALKAGAGSVSVAGLAPTLTIELVETTTLRPGVGLVSAAGQAPSEWRDALALPGSGAITATGRSPSALEERGIGPTTGSAGVSGRAPSLLGSASAQPGQGSVEVQGLAPDLITQGAVAPSMGAIAAEGRAPVLSGEAIVLPGSGAMVAEGRAPEVVVEQSVEATVLPAVGAVTSEGRAPTLLTEVTITPSVGAVGAVGQLSYISTTGVAAPGASAASAVGQAPSLATAIAVTPTATAVTVEGRAPTLLTATAVSPTAGAVSAAGRAATLATERVIVPSVGYARTSAEPPALVEEGLAVAQPAPAATSMAGLAPELLTERRIDPELGAVALLGRLPTVSYEIVGTVSPDAGAVSAEGLAPAVVPASEELAGRLIRRGRKRIPRYAEETVSAGPVVHTSPELRPDPPAHFTVPLSALGGVDTSQIAARIQRLEAQARRRARQRREEEEIVQFLMKVA